MVTIRRSGGLVAFYWQGDLPDPKQLEFTEALANRRFRTIENAASEETSVGWVTPLDPTGDSFSTEDLDAGHATWLRMRIDTKKMPTKWLQIHRDAAEKNAGRKLSMRERRELKDDLMDKLLPRVLPTINLVDALVYPERRTLLLMASSKSVGEHFHKLFFETFTLPLERNDPLQLGRRTGLSPEVQHRLERVDPVRWPKQKRDQEPTATPLPAAIQAAAAAEQQRVEAREAARLAEQEARKEAALANAQNEAAAAAAGDEGQAPVETPPQDHGEPVADHGTDHGTGHGTEHGTRHGDGAVENAEVEA